VDINSKVYTLIKKNSLVIVTDNLFDKKLLSNILSEYQLTFYSDINETYKQVRKEQPELLIIDSTYGNSAYALCKYVANDFITSNVPILFMFCDLNSEDINTMFACGGDDYIVKPFNKIDVITRIYIHTKYAKERQELEALANFDPMTDTLNRRSFFKKADEAIKFSLKSQKELHFTLFNVSTLFEINETYGHFTGDRIIQEFSQILKKILGKEAIIGRLNGNYFSVILIESDTDKVNRLNASVVEHSDTISVDNSHPVKVEYSTVKRYSADESIDDLLLEASEHLIDCDIARTKRNY